MSSIIESANLNIAEKTFTRASIDDLGNRVIMTDKDDATGLELFCYVKCSVDDDNLIHQCRGVVFHEENVVMRAFPYTVELAHTEKTQIEEKIDTIFNKCIFYDSYEGALIRMFNFDGRWFTSTHRKLNAFRSKWASKESFGTTFKRAIESEVEANSTLRESLPDNGEGILERFQTILDPSKQYMFLVLNNDENRIVCSAPNRPSVYHVGTFVNSELVMNENINIPYPKKHEFTSIDELIDHVDKVNINNLQGVIIFAPNNKQYKVVNKEYLNLFNVRGNEPSVKYRYLQVRMVENMVNNLYRLYPTMTHLFEDYENVLYSIAQNIYNSYVDRFIKKKWVTVAAEEFNVIRACHSFHEQDRKQNRISIKKVIDILNEQTPTNLNKMIRRFKNEKLRPIEDKEDSQHQASTNPVLRNSNPNDNKTRSFRPVEDKKNSHHLDSTKPVLRNSNPNDNKTRSFRPVEDKKNSHHLDSTKPVLRNSNPNENKSRSFRPVEHKRTYQK